MQNSPSYIIDIGHISDLAETNPGTLQTSKIEKFAIIVRDGSRTVATSKMERFVIIVNSWKPLTFIRKRSILDISAVLDPPLIVDN